MRNYRNIILVGLVTLLIAIGAFAYSVLRTPQTASAPIQAIPLAESTLVVAATSAPTTEAAAATTAVPEATDATADSSATTLSSDTIIAQIIPEESEVRFVIDEVLNNEPFTVVGTTNQVAGELAIDPSDPAATKVGVIQVNARTLATDSEFRDRAIKNRILMTDDNEYITFTPTALTGLPEQVEIGQSYTFQMTGDLTIRDVTKQVTFEVSVTPESQQRVAGTAQTTIVYSDFGLSIPQVPQVASVDNDVRLEIDFAAAPTA